MKDTLRLTDISTAEGQMVSIDLKDIPDVEGLDLVKMPWRPVTDEQKAKVACILDEVCVLNIPKPQTPQEEEELVNRFLDGMRKLFSKENNWTFLAHAGNQHGLLRPVQLLFRCLSSVRDVRQERDVPPQLPL